MEFLDIISVMGTLGVGAFAKYIIDNHIAKQTKIKVNSENNINKSQLKMENDSFKFELQKQLEIEKNKFERDIQIENQEFQKLLNSKVKQYELQLEKIKFKLRKQEELGEVKQKILFAWQDLYTKNILEDLDANWQKYNYGQQAYIGDKCLFHLGELKAKIEIETIDYDKGTMENRLLKMGYANGYEQLIAFTLMYSNDIKIHHLIQMLNSVQIESSNDEDEEESVDEILTPYSFIENINTVAVHSLIYFYLKIEWLGEEMESLPKNSLAIQSIGIKEKYSEEEVCNEIKKMDSLLGTLIR